MKWSSQWITSIASISGCSIRWLTIFNNILNKLVQNRWWKAKRINAKFKWMSVSNKSKLRVCVIPTLTQKNSSEMGRIWISQTKIRRYLIHFMSTSRTADFCDEVIIDIKLHRGFATYSQYFECLLFRIIADVSSLFAIVGFHYRR